MKNYKKGNATLIIFLVVLILAAGATWYLVQNSQKPATPAPAPTTPLGFVPPTTPPPSTPSVEETAGWETYRNEKYGFSFRYPADWKVDDKSSNGQEFAKVVSVCSPAGECLKLSNGLDSPNLSYRLGDTSNLSFQEKDIVFSIKNF